MRAAEPFHADERALQERMGVREQARQRGAVLIRPFMPEQHQRFFESLPLAFVATLDHTGHPQADAIVGRPGMLRAVTPTLLVVHDTPKEHALHSLGPGAPLGLLGIDFANGRRNRANGVVERRDGDGVALRVTHSFGNCPRHIHVRRPDPVAAAATTALDRRTLVETAATFFIASRSAELDPSRGGGVDISHRGGAPGFVRWADDDTVVFDDVPGNNFFNTLGNIASDPRVSLLFIDFDSGRQVRIAGEAVLVAPAATRQVLVRVRAQHTTLISEMPELRWPLVKLAAPCSSIATGETSPEAQSPVPHPSTKEST
jgi:predicted pyridoxine 5'-phosphate oxidase superfamily flavin-nucleotide-binding protein